MTGPAIATSTPSLSLYSGGQSTVPTWHQHLVGGGLARRFGAAALASSCEDQSRSTGDDRTGGAPTPAEHPCAGRARLSRYLNARDRAVHVSYSHVTTLRDDANLTEACLTAAHGKGVRVAVHYPALRSPPKACLGGEGLDPTLDNLVPPMFERHSKASMGEYDTERGQSEGRARKGKEAHARTALGHSGCARGWRKVQPDGGSEEEDAGDDRNHDSARSGQPSVIDELPRVIRLEHLRVAQTGS